MKFHISVQQLKFYSEHGYVGFENLEIQLPEKKKAERDLWRKEPLLKQQIVHQLGPLALQLTRKTTLYLACDEWIVDPWNLASAIQERLSFQGLVCIVLFSAGTPLFFLHPSTWPSMLPGWPQEPSPCYLIAYGGSDARYIHNPKDPFGPWLKKYGFGFGDSLQKNPIIV